MLTAKCYLSSVVPHFLQTLTLRSPRTSCPIRTGPHVAHTRATFDSRIARSCSAIPPLMLRCGFGRTCFFSRIPPSHHLNGVIPANIHSLVFGRYCSHLESLILNP